MPKIKINGRNIYYEIHGEGETVIFLNGIMMSTASWAPFINGNVFEGLRVILIDLVDQGRSDRADEPYTQDFHVETLRAFIEELDLGRVHLMGISYGGEVSMKFALKYQDKLKSLILSNTTSYTNHIMRDIEGSWDYAAGTHDGKTFFKVTMPTIYSSKFYEENIGWLREREKAFSMALTDEWYERFRRAAKSASDLNITDELHKIEVSVLIIGSEFDTITPVRYQEEIHRRIKNSKMVVIKDSGHASMYEKPYEFALLLVGFLKTYNKEIKIL